MPVLKYAWRTGTSKEEGKEEKKKVPEPEEEIEEVEESEDEGEDPALDSLSQAIAFQQAKIEEEQRKWRPGPGVPPHPMTQDGRG